MATAKAHGSDADKIYSLFFDGTCVSVQTINTSRDEHDFRETLIVTASSGDRYVIKLADNDFTFPKKIAMWQRTVKEYRALGYYCPLILTDKNGGFPEVSYKGHSCIVYAEEFSTFSPIEDRANEGAEADFSLYEK